jgi:enoyl-CoA hydratase
MKAKAEKKGKVFTVIINRPEVRNAVDRETAEALSQAFRTFEEDDSSYVAVLYGEGGNFCAGADLKAMMVGRGNRVEVDGDGPMGPTRMRLSKPVIAAVSGYAVAGGLELAIWCDMRVVEKDAVFGVFCRRWGVPLMDGGTIRLARLIGLSRALDMILTGRPVSSDEALLMGLANKVVPNGAARLEAEKLAAQIAEFPQICVRHDRLSTYEGLNLGFDEAMTNEFCHGKAVLDSLEPLRGVKRFTHGAGRHGEF